TGSSRRRGRRRRARRVSTRSPSRTGNRRSRTSPASAPDAGNGHPHREPVRVAAKKRPSRLRPKTPSRVKRRKRKQRGPRGHQHPELVGLGLTAFGLFLGTVVYAGWSGGYVRAALADALRAVVGGATYGLPAALAGIGLLMLTRSALVDVRPFRTGLLVGAVGVEIALGRNHGGFVGRALGGLFGFLLGTTGTTILGI